MSRSSDPRRLWQVAGALALAHIALMLSGFTLTPVARLGASPASAVATYRSSSAVGAGIGGAISLLGFIALLVAVPLIGRALRGATEAGGWLSSVIVTSGTLYVGLTLAVPYAASGVARYGARSGMAAGTVAALSDLHWFGDFLSTVVLGVFTLAVAAAVWRTRALPRWVAIAGLAAGACCLATAVSPPESVLDDVTLIWMVWFVLLAVAALRAGRATRDAEGVGFEPTMGVTP
jgi:hypothetical protein